MMEEGKNRPISKVDQLGMLVQTENRLLLTSHILYNPDTAVLAETGTVS